MVLNQLPSKLYNEKLRTFYCYKSRMIVQGQLVEPAVCFSDLKARFVVLLFYVHGKHRRSCRDSQLT